MDRKEERLSHFIENPAAYDVLVVGGGKSGFAALQFLKRKGAAVSLSDSGVREEKSSELIEWLKKEKIEAEFGGHTLKAFQDADVIVVSPGVPRDIPPIVEAGNRDVPIIGEMGLASCFIDIPIVAVTGTNGKTTVTEMVGAMLQADAKKVFVGGNIGTPVTEFILENGDAEAAVLEVSSFQLETAGTFRPKVGVLLNITPDHLDRYSSYEEYGDTKFELFRNQQPEDAMVLNAADEEIMARLEKLGGKGKKYFFGRGLEGMPGAEWKNDHVEICWERQGRKEQYVLPAQMKVSPVRDNCMAAILAARLIGCSERGVTAGLQEFQIPPHRVTLVAEINNVAYYDDSKATNIGAVQSALAGMERPVILIAGGRDKGGDYALLTEKVREKVKKLLLIGEAGEKMAKALEAHTEVEMLQDLDAAVKRAAELAVKGDAVLLSPACSSFDMFRSYVDRGEHFQKAVGRLLDK